MSIFQKQDLDYDEKSLQEKSQKAHQEYLKQLITEQLIRFALKDKDKNSVIKKATRMIPKSEIEEPKKKYIKLKKINEIIKE
jgi:hypothetical protein